MTTKQEIIQKGVEKVLEEHKVPYAVHLQVIRELKQRLSQHETYIKESQQTQKEYLKTLAQYAKAFDTLDAEVQRIIENPSKDGDKGDPGDDGYTPIKGVDYFDGEPGKNAEPVNVSQIVDVVLSRIQMEEKTEKEEEPLDTMALAKELVDLIRKEKLIDISDIKNYQSMKRGAQISGSGVPSLTAGANVVLTPKPDGGYTVSASGGGSGSNLANQVVTGVQAGADVTIALSQLTHFATLVTPVILVMRNQIPQTPGVTYTETATVVTVKDADAGDTFAITYAYA